METHTKFNELSGNNMHNTSHDAFMTLHHQKSIEEVDESDDEKIPPFLENVENSLRKEYLNYSQKFEFPINPAFFNSTNIRQPTKMQTLSSYLKDRGIASNQSQN